MKVIDDDTYNSIKDEIKDLLPVFYNNVSTEVDSVFYSIVMATIHVMKKREYESENR